MPIKPASLSSPEPEKDPLPTVGEQPPVKPPDRKGRRKKVELIADAVIPGDDDVVKLKDQATGSEIERPWLVAVELFRAGKVEFVDQPDAPSPLKYAVMKMDEQRAVGSEPGSPDDPTTSVDGSVFRPDAAHLGDQVVINGDNYYVGHGNRLTGTRPTYGPNHSREGQQVDLLGKWQGDNRVSLVLSKPNDGGTSSSGGSSAKPFPVAQTLEHVGSDTWKVGMGYLEKIGLPEYSSLQIGPVNAQRHIVVTSGEMVSLTRRDGTVISAPKQVVDAMTECGWACEIAMKSERQAMINFLEAVKS